MEESQRTSTHPLAVQCAESNRFQPMTLYHPSINNSGIIKTFTAPPNAKHKPNKKHEYNFYRYHRHKNHFLAFKMREHLATQTTNISTSCNYIRAKLMPARRLGWAEYEKTNQHNRENLAFSRDLNATKHQRNPTHRTQAADGEARWVSRMLWWFQVSEVENHLCCEVFSKSPFNPTYVMNFQTSFLIEHHIDFLSFEVIHRSNLIYESNSCNYPC